ncbi:MAG: N-acetylmannosamine-6-phosphate 2-epimerase [Alicyclobacillus sp.]|nr:N-acetylmannosamine-6-phosphate 2-epimerase [Alicyclobacillus sp.]
MKMPFLPGLVVSCQALEDEPLHGSSIMAKMAEAAQQGGAVAIRANSPDDIMAIKAAVNLPIIGIYKVHYANSPMFITPTLSEVLAVIGAGADIVSVDATNRKRPGESLAELVSAIHTAKRLAMADVSTVDEGIQAAAIGFDMVATTLVGYTSYTMNRPLPDMETIKQLCGKVDVPVLAEGHISTPSQLRACFECGVYAVVVGTAITRPQKITQNFVHAYHEWRNENSKQSECRGHVSWVKPR